MKNILTFLGKAIYFSLLYICISFPLSFRLSNLGIVALVVFWLLKKILSKEPVRLADSSKNEKWILYTFFALFIWQAITLLYTDNIESGLKNLEGKLSLIVLPLILCDLRIPLTRLHNLVKYYVYSLLVCTIFLLAQSVQHLFQFGSFLTYHNFTRSLDFHAVFYSYYTYLSILFVFMLFNKMNLKKYEQVLFIISLVFSFVALIISASKNVIVVSVLSMVMVFAVRILRNKLKHREVVIAIIVVACSGVVISQIPSIKNRYLELGKLDGMDNLAKIDSGQKLEHEDRIKFNGTSLRIVLWSIGLDKVVEEGRVFLGLTPGDRRDILNEEFYSNGLNPAYENYNLHNQYVQTFVEMGLVGLLIYLLLNFLYFKSALSTQNYLLLMFMVAFTIFQMTESVLERNKGIVFFVFFVLFLQKLTLQGNEDRNIRN